MENIKVCPICGVSYDGDGVCEGCRVEEERRKLESGGVILYEYGEIEVELEDGRYVYSEGDIVLDILGEVVRLGSSRCNECDSGDGLRVYIKREKSEFKLVALCDDCVELNLGLLDDEDEC